MSAMQPTELSAEEKAPILNYKEADPVEPSAPGVRYLGTVRMMTTVNTRDRKRRAHANVGLYTMIYLKVYK